MNLSRAKSSPFSKKINYGELSDGIYPGGLPLSKSHSSCSVSFYTCMFTSVHVRVSHVETRKLLYIITHRLLDLANTDAEICNTRVVSSGGLKGLKHPPGSEYSC